MSSGEAGKLHLQIRKRKLKVSEEISYKMHPVMLDVYNFSFNLYRNFVNRRLKKFDSKRIYRI